MGDVNILFIEVLICLIVIGICTGFASGLLGVGGGFILTPTLFFLMMGNNVDSVSALKISLGTSLAIMSPVAVFSSYNHYKNSKFDIKLGLMLGCFGLIGGLIGGSVAVNSNSEVLRSILGVVLIVISLNMFFKKQKSQRKMINEDLKLDLKNYFMGGILGLGIGFLSGLFSIGGGIFIIPILTLFLELDMIEAIKTSTIFISITAIGGLIPYLLTNVNTDLVPFLIGYVDIFYLLVVLSFSIPTSYFGVNLTYKINEKLLKKILALIIIFMSLKLIFS
ncbi:MAG: sulfite exporter TauE/SafE family protein [Methanobrevibacter sp.]|jgi:uncharacterized membrane protein YfcA|nr:sulfite exporter TauE/SafE family protein [Candidatus Methanovirga basalitermitum]